MRHGTFQNRSQNRNRHRGGQGGSGQRSSNGNGSHRPHRNQVLDSNGPDVRVRGTAFQINEKYLALAKDASSSGDLILAENYLQHAEHYQRMINEFEPQSTHQQPAYGSAGDDSAGDVHDIDEGEATSTRRTSSPAVESSQDGEEGGARMVRRQPRRRVPSEDEDLGLPTSILGGEAANA